MSDADQGNTSLECVDRLHLGFRIISNLRSTGRDEINFASAGLVFDRQLKYEMLETLIVQMNQFAVVVDTFLDISTLAAVCS